MPAAQALQALLLLVQLGQGQLVLGDLLVDLGQVLATLGHELDPFGLPGGGVHRGQPLAVGWLRRRPEASATLAVRAWSVGSSDDADDLADGRAPVGRGHLLRGATRKRAMGSNHPAAPYGHPDPDDTKPSRQHCKHPPAATSQFWSWRGGLEPPTCWLQDSGESSAGCWRVLSLQLRSDARPASTLLSGRVAADGMTVRLPGGSVMIRAAIGGSGRDSWND